MRSPEERRRRRLKVIGGSTAFVVLGTALEVILFSRVAPSLASRVLLFVFFNLNLLALFWLVLFVGRSLVKLAIERKQGIAGHKFKTKIVGIFLLLISMPLTIMFLVSSELVTNYIDRFFSPQFRKPVEGSLKVAQTMYMLERMRALDAAYLARTGGQLPNKYTARFIDEPPEEGGSASIQAAFEGKEETEVISLEGGDLIRAALPVLDGDRVRAVVIVETSLPPEIMEGINSIKKAYDDYMHLEKWKSPLKLSYMMMMAFFTLMIIFVAIWISLRIAGWMTEPVKELSLATTEVAEGNYDVRVETTAQDEMGQLIGSFNRMVQEIRESKGSLEQAYANLDNIVKNIHSGVISLGMDETVRSINEAACNIFGVTSEDVMGRSYRVLMAGLESVELEEFVRSINIRTLREVQREVWVAISGRKSLLSISITSMRTQSGEQFGMLVVVNDITDVIKAQRTLAWQEVARRMAHEIKNPLTPIKLSTERMLRKWQSRSDDFDSVIEKSTATITREVDSLRAMVDEFSRFGKLPEIKRQRTDLGEIIRDVRSLYKGYKQVVVKLELLDDMPMVELDPEQFKRVFINLFDNAIEAMKRKGELTVTAKFNKDLDKVSVQIRDTGSGISDEDKERLFQPYFSTKRDGTGLGLAIADRIVAEHGGALAVADNVPEGSVFIIEIPIHV
jgi:two-component system nitrogen regulation sensor histidine kinase NtrY